MAQGAAFTVRADRRAPEPATRRPLLPSWPRHLDRTDRAALAAWAAAHLTLLALAWLACWAFQAGPPAPLAGAFDRWDAAILHGIAAHGYLSGGSDPHAAAFFPGYPLALAAVHQLLRNWTLSELALSAAAGCFAVVSLARLAGNRRAVLYLLTMPAAVFLMLGYGEVLYLALAVPAWHAASRGQWKRAALLAALAGLARPDAAFMFPALAAMALTTPGTASERLKKAAWSLGALTGPAAYWLYLRAVTGSWQAWQHAQQAGWDMHLVTPWSAWVTTWRLASGRWYPAGFSLEYQLEIAAAVAMLAATAAFAARRRWPEAAYCGCALIAVATQTWYQGFPRTLLVLFPVWVALARAEGRYPWVRGLWLSFCAPLAAVFALMFLAGQWAG